MNEQGIKNFHFIAHITAFLVFLLMLTHMTSWGNWEEHYQWTEWSYTIVSYLLVIGFWTAINEGVKYFFNQPNSDLITPEEFFASVKEYFGDTFTDAVRGHGNLEDKAPCTYFAYELYRIDDVSVGLRPKKPFTPAAKCVYTVNSIDCSKRLMTANGLRMLADDLSSHEGFTKLAGHAVGPLAEATIRAFEGTPTGTFAPERGLMSDFKYLDGKTEVTVKAVTDLSAAVQALAKARKAEF